MGLGSNPGKNRFLKKDFEIFECFFSFSIIIVLEHTVMCTLGHLNILSMNDFEDPPIIGPKEGTGWPVDTNQFSNRFVNQFFCFCAYSVELVCSDKWLMLDVGIYK